MVYMAICFTKNREKIKSLVDDIEVFEKFAGVDAIKIDQETNFYSKLLIGYSIAGMLIYSIAPLFVIDYCEQHKPKSMEQYGVPCSMIVRFRLPFRFDSWPMHQVVFLYQFYVGSMTSILIVTITVLICGIMMHIENQLKHLHRFMIDMVVKNNIEESRSRVRFAVQYHIEIIEYLKRVNEAFGSQVVLHFTLTSFVISVLGFEIIMVGNVPESLRYTLHLCGWVVLLYLLSYYGQRVMDEGFEVANAAYNGLWYTTSADIQKDIRLIIARSQQPLTLKAMYLGSMTVSTFLKVLSSAYSYFTLLLNIRK
ncbi:odorant receptor 4-like [Onthophagus taurus]|uniref:odorant receptor 4-like n=1 Tax=Onthophagus taurus TaxID=166361 RepID=UPI0039BDDA5C